MAPVDHSPDVTRLAGIARAARAGLEFALQSSGFTGVAGACMHGSILCREMLGRWWHGGAVIRGGDGEGDGGYFDAHGRGHGHYWVEASSANGRWVIDVTADQFGGPPVVIMSLAAARARYQPGVQSLVDIAATEVCSELRLPAAVKE